MLNINFLAKKAAEALAETLYPTRCVHCDEPGVLLCEKCKEELTIIDPNYACIACGAPFGFLACTECSRSATKFAEDEIPVLCPGEDFEPTPLFPFHEVRGFYVYEDCAKSILTSYKDAGELRLEEIIGQGIYAAACNLKDKPDAVTRIPANPKHVKARGYDHMKSISKFCANKLNMPMLDILDNASKKRGLLDQRELSAKQRQQNKSGSFVIKEYKTQLPEHILLIDDVMTTGATLSAAANALLAAGAKCVDVAVFARVW